MKSLIFAILLSFASTMSFAEDLKESLTPNQVSDFIKNHREDLSEYLSKVEASLSTSDKIAGIADALIDGFEDLHDRPDLVEKVISILENKAIKQNSEDDLIRMSLLDAMLSKHERVRSSARYLVVFYGIEYRRSLRSSQILDEAFSTENSEDDRLLLAKAVLKSGRPADLELIKTWLLSSKDHLVALSADLSTDFLLEALVNGPAEESVLSFLVSELTKRRFEILGHSERLVTLTNWLAKNPVNQAPALIILTGNQVALPALVAPLSAEPIDDEAPMADSSLVPETPLANSQAPSIPEVESQPIAAEAITLNSPEQPKSKIDVATPVFRTQAREGRTAFSESNEIKEWYGMLKLSLAELDIEASEEVVNIWLDERNEGQIAALKYQPNVALLLLIAAAAAKESSRTVSALELLLRRMKREDVIKVFEGFLTSFSKIFPNSEKAAEDQSLIEETVTSINSIIILFPEYFYDQTHIDWDVKFKAISGDFLRVAGEDHINRTLEHEYYSRLMGRLLDLMEEPLKRKSLVLVAQALETCRNSESAGRWGSLLLNNCRLASKEAEVLASTRRIVNTDASRLAKEASSLLIDIIEKLKRGNDSSVNKAITSAISGFNASCVTHYSAKKSKSEI